MKTSAEKQTLAPLKTRAAQIGAGALLALLSANALVARAEAASKHLRYPKPLPELTRETTQKIAKHGTLTAYPGTLIFRDGSNASITEPIAVFRGDPKKQAGHTDLRNGDWAFAYEIPSNHSPNITLMAFDPATMSLTK